MRAGVMYMGHHNPKHIKADIMELRWLRVADVLVPAQENECDSIYIWALDGQVGTAETCDDPENVWRTACAVLEMAQTQAAHPQQTRG